MGCGITLTKDNKWQAQIVYNGKTRYVGIFDSEETARSAVKLARNKLAASDGSIYEGEELKRIIKCARDAARAEYESEKKKDGTTMQQPPTKRKCTDKVSTSSKIMVRS